MWVIVIIVLLLFFARQTKLKIHPFQNKNWFLELALSKEDAVSQWFFLLSVFFLGIAILLINRELKDPFPWQTIILITACVGLVVTYFYKVLATLIWSLMGLMVWWGIQATEWTKLHSIKTTSILVGFTLMSLVFYTIGQYYEKNLKYKRFSVAYTLIGIISLTGSLFLFSSKIGLDLLSNMTEGVTFFASWQITIVMVVLVVTLGIMMFDLVSKKRIVSSEALMLSSFVVIFGLLAFLPKQQFLIGRSDELTSSGLLWAIIFNVILFSELLGLIFSGYIKKEEWLINVGTFLLFVFIVIKYFDWFFTFLDKSVFFVVAGILLFALGSFMEEKRRDMIARIKPNEKPQPHHDKAQ